MKQVLYACTHVTKEVEEDFYETGLLNNHRACTMSERCDIAATTLPELLKEVGEHYGLDIDNVFIPGDEAEDVTYIGYNRLETEDCYVPTPHEMTLFQQGKFRLWLCDYTFAVERRVVEPLTEKDFADAGIKTH